MNLTLKNWNSTAFDFSSRISLAWVECVWDGVQGGGCVGGGGRDSFVNMSFPYHQSKDPQDPGNTGIGHWKISLFTSLILLFSILPWIMVNISGKTILTAIIYYPFHPCVNHSLNSPFLCHSFERRENLLFHLIILHTFSMAH